MGVIGHEYGHMIENRMIGKGNVRVGHHAGAMGESFGDLNGMEYQNENGFVPVGDENRYAVGDVRHRQQAAGDPQLRDELPDVGRRSRSLASSSTSTR